MAAKKQQTKSQGAGAKKATGASKGGKSSGGIGKAIAAAASAVVSAVTALFTHHDAPATPQMERRKTHSFRRRLIGLVTSDKMDKTVVVEVARYSRDRVYKKYVKHRTKFKAHDERNEYKTGDRVEIQEHAPMSREKRFMVVRLVTRAVAE